MTDQPPDRLSLEDAAAVLGISREAVRLRVRRGTLAGERVSGRWYVSLVGRSATDQTTDQPQRPGRSRLPSPRRDELVAALQSEVEDLRRRLDRSQEAEAELRRLLLGALQRLPAPMEGESTIAHEPSQPAPTPQPESPPAARSPWWRRIFGGKNPQST